MRQPAHREVIEENTELTLVIKNLTEAIHHQVVTEPAPENALAGAAGCSASQSTNGAAT